MATITTVTLPDSSINDIRASSISYGAVDSTSTATVFTATVPGVTELYDGVCVMLKNGVVTSASNCTLNVNGLGAKPIYSSLAAATRDTTIFNANYTMLFVYDTTRVSGGCWVCYRGYDSNTNTIGYQIRTNSYSLPMKSITYRYRILFTSADNKGFVPATNSTSTNATESRTVCQDPINPLGSIVYYGTTASVAAGSRPSAANLWQQYGITLGYSFNQTGAALTLTAWKPVYVKCAPQSDGTAIIDSTTPYVQDLPTTADGKIYIFLGVAYSETAVELTLNHPVYEYKDGCIRLWTNASTSSGGAVSSVNGQTGVVVLDATDVGALPDTTVIPTSTSDLANDSNFVADATYVHTDNNFTTTLKDKLDGIEAGAEVNVQADWNEADSSDDAYIKNKPSIPTQTSDLTNDSDFVTDASYVHTDNNFTTTLKDKLDGIASGAEANVQSDWNEADSTADSYIQNKPSIPTNTSDLNNDSGYITGMYIAGYGKSTYAEVLAAYRANKVVYCRASSSSNPASGNQLRMAFLAYVNNEATPTEFEFQYYRSVATHSNTQQGDQVYVYKLKQQNGWEFSVREAYTKIVAGTGLTSSYSNGVLTISLA